MGTESPDLRRETKYSLVKNSISTAKFIESTEDYNYATVITDGNNLEIIPSNNRAVSARASSPASESSPRPGSSVTPRRSGRSSLSSHLEPSETESIRNFGEEEKQDEQLSITSANDDN